MPRKTRYQVEQENARKEFAQQQRNNLARSGYVPGGNPADYTPGSGGIPGAPGSPLAQDPAAAGGPPVDPYYEAQRAASQRALRLGEAADTYQMGQVNARFGFDAAGGIDLNNPFSEAALMQKRYQEQMRGNSTSYASRGQLYSGALQNAQQYAGRQFDIGIDQLKKQRQDAVSQILLGKLNRYSQTTGDIDQAQLDALMKALGG